MTILKWNYFILFTTILLCYQCKNKDTFYHPSNYYGYYEIGENIKPCKSECHKKHLAIEYVRIKNWIQDLPVHIYKNRNQPNFTFVVTFARQENKINNKSMGPVIKDAFITARSMNSLFGLPLTVVGIQCGTLKKCPIYISGYQSFDIEFSVDIRRWRLSGKATLKLHLNVYNCRDYLCLILPIIFH